MKDINKTRKGLGISGRVQINRKDKGYKYQDVFNEVHYGFDINKT